jgi:hypothetical protein
LPGDKFAFVFTSWYGQKTAKKTLFSLIKAVSRVLQRTAGQKTPFDVTNRVIICLF